MAQLSAKATCLQVIAYHWKTNPFKRVYLFSETSVIWEQSGYLLSDFQAVREGPGQAVSHTTALNGSEAQV